MKRSKYFLGVCVFSAFLFLTTNMYAQDHKKKWDVFSANLVKTVKSNHPGLRNSAMQLIIQYSDSLDVSDAVYDIMQIFRFNDDQRVRRLAMITLSKINTDKATAYLSKYLKFEENESIKNQGYYIISEYIASKKSDKNEDLRFVSNKNK